MKTKFTSIVKVKAQKLKDIEAALARSRGEVNRAVEAVEKVVNEIKSMEIPQRGNISLLQISHSTLSSLQGVKKEKELFLEVCKQRVEKVLIEYKKAHIDFEKMKHLDDVEVAKKLKDIKHLEQKELDEMSVVLYNLQKQGGVS